MERSIDFHDNLAYAFYMKGEDVKNSASGGFFYAFASKWIAEKGAVVGVVWDKNCRNAHHVLLKNDEELEKIRSSKYIQSRKNNIYCETGEVLELGIKVLFSGLPCEIVALYQYLSAVSISDENLVTCEIVCHGPTSTRILNSFIDDLEEKYDSKVSNLNMRYKKAGWTPQYILAEFENEKKYCHQLSSSSFGYGFQIVKRPSCENCIFKNDNRKADFTIGDFWGTKPNVEYYNRYGVSVVFARTKKAKCIIENSLFDDLDYVKRVDGSVAVASNPRQLTGKPGLIKTAPEIRKKYFELFNENGKSSDAFKYFYKHTPLKTKIYMCVPAKLFNLLKEAWYKKIRK